MASTFSWLQRISCEMFGWSSAAREGTAPVGRTMSFAETRPVDHQTKITMITGPATNRRRIGAAGWVIHQATATVGRRIIAPRK